LSKGDSEGLNVFDLDESEHFDFVMLFGWVTHGHSLTKSTLAIGNPWIDYLRKWVSTKANKGRCKIKRAIP
jgi:glutamate-1-semialdehyde aminotransferase